MSLFGFWISQKLMKNVLDLSRWTCVFEAEISLREDLDDVIGNNFCLEIELLDFHIRHHKSIQSNLCI